MLDALNNDVLRIMDYLLGWMLLLPKDVALGIVAVGTAALMTLVRPFTTDQDVLRRAKADKKKLNEFIRAAKKRKDKAAVERFRATFNQIGMKTMKYEGKPLLVAVLPVLFLAIWAFARLGFEAPAPGEPIKVRAYFPSASIDAYTHIVPVDGLTARTGWVQRIAEDKDAANKAIGVATWELEARQNDKPYVLEIRAQGKTVTKEFLVDGRQYSPEVEMYNDAPVQAVQLELKPYKPFGFIPALRIPPFHVPYFDWAFGWLAYIALDAWLVGYLVIAVPFVFLLRWALRIN